MYKQKNKHRLDHIRLILSGALQIVELIDIKKQSVMIHCSDGKNKHKQANQHTHITNKHPHKQTNTHTHTTINQSIKQTNTHTHTPTSTHTYTHTHTHMTI